MKKSALDHWIEKTEALPELTREGLDALQLRRLNQVLEKVHLKDCRYPSHLDSLDALKSLPFTTQEMLSEHPGRFLLTSQSEISRIISGATSGTTGPAKRVFYTARDTANTVGFFAAGISEMLSAGEKCIICFPFSGPFGLGDLIAQAVVQLGGIPVRAGYGQSWGELAELVRQEKPETYIGFPVALLSLVRFYGGAFPIRRALVSADACPQGVMDELEKALGSPLYPHYGSRECGLGGAVTCSAFHGMHLRENHLIPEIIDSYGNVLPEGQWGELVLTTIGMEAMPLIRYRTGDFTRLLPPCPCGSIARRLDTVVRKEDPLPISQLDSLLFTIPELVDYQVSWKNGLTIQALVTCPTDALCQLMAKAYPHFPVHIEMRTVDTEDKPLYLGKRHIRK